jgi:zinc protease
LRLYEPPQPARFQLSNGMKVLLLENHETPLVSVTALIRAGSVFDPPDRAGLAALAGALLRSGGVNRRTPERLDADLEALGTTIESNISETSGIVTMSSLKETLGESLALFRAVLAEPSFRQDRIDLQRAAAINAIGRRNDDPAALDYEFRARIYGHESARARRPEYSTIGRITRGDITTFYRRYFFPANVILAVSGDFDTAQMKDILESLFGGWKNDQAPVGEFPKEANPSPGGYVAVKPGLRETYFTAGRSGGFFNDKDDAASEVAAAVLGAGARKRLALRAPDASGSTGELHAEWRPGFGVPGAFSVTGASRPQDTGETIRTVFDEIEKLRTTETTDEDLRIAREAVLIRFSSGLDKPAKALELLAKLEYYGYSANALQQFQKAVAAVTRADVLRAAKEQLDPAGLTVVAFSSVTGFEKPLHPRAGADMPIDLAIPPFPTERGAGPDTSSEQGKLLLQRAQQAAGGVERLAAVKDFTQTASYKLQAGGTESQTDRWIPPFHVRQDAQSTAFGALYRYTDGTTGWLSNGRSSLALTGINAKQAREETLRSYISLLLSDRVPGRVISALDEQTIEITQGDLATRVVFDPQTGLPSKLLYELQMERQPVIFAEEELSDYREVNGIKLPFAIGVFRNGVKYSDGLVSEYKFNQGLKTEILQRRP